MDRVGRMTEGPMLLLGMLEMLETLVGANKRN